MTNCYGTITYEYDDFSNLKKVTLQDGKVIEYKVDGLNRRTKKLVNGQTKEYYIWYDQTHLAAILDQNKNPKLIYIYGPESNAPSYVIKDNITYRILHDPGLDSIRYIVNKDTRQIAQEIEYDEYGNTMKNTNVDFQPLSFAGGLSDQDTKFIRFGARDYDPTVGRWTTKDPIGFAGGDTNLYAYVGGNPMSAVDPSGHFGVAGAAVGGLFGIVGGLIVSAHNGTDLLNGAIIGGATGAAIGSGAALFAATAEILGVSVASQTGAAALGAAHGAFFGNLTSQALVNKKVDFNELMLVTSLAPFSGGASTLIGRGLAGEIGVSTVALPFDILGGTLNNNNNQCPQNKGN